MRILILILLAQLALTPTLAPALAAAPASHPVSVTKTADWVTPSTFDAAAPEKSLQFDTQIKRLSDHHALYRHYATRIETPADIRAMAEVSLALVPEKEHLNLHYIRVHRAGSVRNVALPAPLAVFAPDGAAPGYAPHYVRVELPPLQEGDIVEWAATWDVTTPDMPGHLYHDFFTDWAVASAAHRTIIRSATPLTIKRRGNAAPLSFAKDGDELVYTWEARHTKPVAYIDQTPADHFTYGSVSVSSLGSWADVAAWGSDRYAAQPLPIELANAAAAHQHLTVNERATWAIRFVQDRLPYDHLRRGLSTHLPRTPAETMAAGTGDCKDKAVLLVSLLAALDIEAYVALTDLDEGAALPHRAPSPFSFDHAIVRITSNEDVVYIDPTLSQQGGTFPNIPSAAYSYALPLTDGATLEKISPVTATATPQLAVTETFDFTTMSYEGIILETQTVRRGRDADHFRRMWAAAGGEILSSEYTEFYAARFPEIYPMDYLTVRDDRQANEVVLTERYLIPTHAVDLSLLASFPIPADGARHSALSPTTPSRTAPLAVQSGEVNQHTIKLVGADGIDLPFGDVRTDVSGVSFERAMSQQGGVTSLVFTSRADTDRITGADLTALAHAAAEFRQSLDLRVDLSSLGEQMLAEGRMDPRAAMIGFDGVGLE